MENASKALIMAASILLGVMIISVGVALFQTFSNFSKTTLNKVEETKIAEWNNAYLKYYGTMLVGKEGEEIAMPIQVTAHDIITVLNQAKQNNIDYFEEDWNNLALKKDENTYYVQIDIKITSGKTERCAEKWTEEQKNKFLKEHLLNENNETFYFKCTKYETSKTTKRVNYMLFEIYDKY